jgi:hypothetical protein
MQYRVTAEFKDGTTKHMNMPSVFSTEIAADKAREGEYWDKDDILTILPEIRCSTHGWAYMDTGFCSECMDEYYHPDPELDEAWEDWLPGQGEPQPGSSAWCEARGE